MNKYRTDASQNFLRPQSAVLSLNYIVTGSWTNSLFTNSHLAETNGCRDRGANRFMKISFGRLLFKHYSVKIIRSFFWGGGGSYFAASLFKSQSNKSVATWNCVAVQLHQVNKRGAADRLKMGASRFLYRRLSSLLSKHVEGKMAVLCVCVY